MTEWRVQLQGNNSDFQRLKEIFLNHDPTIVYKDDNFYLKSVDLDQFQDAGQVRNQAKHLIELLDGAAYVHFRDIAPMTIGHIVRIEDDGRKQHFVFGEAHLTLADDRLIATATVIGPDGQPIESKQEHAITRFFQASANHPAVADALKFLRKDDWGSLYKAYEIVRDEVHGDKRIISEGWLTKKSISRFTQTAQSREAIGDDARHASRKYKPPKEPLPVHEARVMIRNLLQKWIDSLSDFSL